MYAYEKEESRKVGGYFTPESFRRPKTLEKKKEDKSQETSEVKQLNNYTLQQPERQDIEGKKMSNQVFGTSHFNYQNPNTHRLEPLAGRNIPPRNGRPMSYPVGDRDAGERQAYESPRQPDYISTTYRSGRPDLGFVSTNEPYVPYPQEPIRRRQEYMQPPEIGFDPYADLKEPKKLDISMEDDHGPHPGWILLLRFHRDGEANVRRALTMCAKHIDADSGRILGLARSYGVRIREGGDAWVTFGKMRHFDGGNWDVQTAPTLDETNYCVLAIYYPSLSRAIQWFDRDSCFKQKDFPSPYTTDCIALPLNSSVDTKNCKTLVMTEYPRISHPEYFRDKFSIPTEDMMLSRFRASPYVVKTTSVPIDDPHQRVARHLRGSWIKRNSIITVSLFDSLQETHRYFTDPEYYKCKEAQDKVSAPTTVIMDLEDWKL